MIWDVVVVIANLSSLSGLVFKIIALGISFLYKGIQTIPSFLIRVEEIAYLDSKISNAFLLVLEILICVQSFLRLSPIELIFKISFS